MFLGGASYNNGVLPFKRYILGEAYTSSGQAAESRTGATRSGERPLPPWCAAEPASVPHWETGPLRTSFASSNPAAHDGTVPEIALPNITGGVQNLNEPGVLTCTCQIGPALPDGSLSRF